MGQLAEFLKAEAETIRSEKQRRQRELDEWRGMLTELYARIDSWLTAIDPSGLLDVDRQTIILNDPSLGFYRAPLWRIEVGYHSVEIVPRGRRSATTIHPPGEKKSIRAHGVVEIRGVRRSCYLYQLPGPNWFIQAEREERGDDVPVVPLDADNFEATLAGFLR